MGDVALAIFPFTEGDEEAACCRALDAAIAGLKAMDRFNAGRGGEGLGPVRLGIAPHLGWFRRKLRRNILVSMGPYLLWGVSGDKGIFTIPDELLAADD